MPVVSDFTHIIGDDDEVVGEGGDRTFEFDTGGRHAAGTAFISFMVRGMTVTNDNALIELNNVRVGELFNNKGGNLNHWHTQTVSFSGSRLDNGNNVLRVNAVDNPPGQGSGQKDNFLIRNVICHFKQDV